MPQSRPEAPPEPAAEAGGTSRRGFLKGSLLGSAGLAAASSARPAHAAGAASKELVAVATTVNGQPQALVVDPDTSAVTVLRDELRLTGTKVACGAGTCGACTVLVDGRTTCACLLPAVSLEGRQVTTIEGVAPGKLHPVQRAFMAKDALQCGYCTPGFIVEAVAFYDRWRADRAAMQAAHEQAVAALRKGEPEPAPVPTEPSLDLVAEAMAGHLCRCGAYNAIYEAVQAACRGDFDRGDPVPARVDAREKVTGAAQYTVDLAPEGVLVGKVLRSPHAAAVVEAIDLEPARSLPGVDAVVALVQPGASVRYADQELAAVAAVDEASAAAALAAIAVRYQVREHVVDMDQARENRVLVYGESRPKEVPSAAEGPVLGAKWEGNLRGPFKSDMLGKAGGADKRVDAAKAEGRLVEGRFRTQVQCHTALEPHCAIALWRDPPADLERGEVPRSTLELWTSSQAVTYLAEEVAQHFKLRTRDVSVHAEYVGGGFGAKATLGMEHLVAIELSRACKKPVKVVLDRAEELSVGGYRPESALHVELAHTADGTFEALRSTAWSNSGVAVGHLTGMLVRLLYPSDYKRLLDYDVVTNTPPGKPLRGPGGPMAMFALEQVVDDAAYKLGTDPLTVRRAWDGHEPRRRLYEWIERQPAWRERGGDKGSGRYRTGVGLACGSWFSFVQRGVQVQLDVSPDGVVASSACQDMGNGSRTVVATAVAERLGIAPHEVTVRFGHSQDVPGPMSGGSRTAASIGPAATDAAERFLVELAKAARDQLGWEDAEAAPGGVRTASGDKRWEEVIAQVGAIRVVGRRERDPEGYFLPISPAGISIGKHLGGAVQLTRVEVDTWTGKVRVTESWIGLGAGRIKVPTLARTQVQGGVVQGIGYALYEERRVDARSGQVLTRGMDDYRIPGIGDIPPVHVQFDEEGFEGWLGEGVGISELATLPTAASVANAVRDAIGWRPTTLPIRPDRVLEALS